MDHATHIRPAAPVIGINTTFLRQEAERESCGTRITYIAAVEQAGGHPVLLPVTSSCEIVRTHVALCDGFVFIGGGDIDPRRYGKEPHPMNEALDPRREHYDFHLIEEVIEARKPFLAICLGCQEVNVWLGGSLIQDIPSETATWLAHASEQAPYFSRHRVSVVPGTRLAEIVACESLLVNSSHHQAIEKLGSGATLAARSEDGLIEAFELDNYPFGVCVQWHPEALIEEPAHAHLFRALVEAAAAHS